VSFGSYGSGNDSLNPLECLDGLSWKIFHERPLTVRNTYQDNENSADENHQQ
jgi:hypothetical protein